MRVRLRRSAIVFAFGVGIISCTDPTGPTATESDLVVRTDVVASVRPTILISQIYGGGGNSGATYKNDFIELFNPGTVPVNVGGWSVQYASAAGSSWQVTALTGTIQPGAYYLVQESGAASGFPLLPTADAVATINLSGTAGKVFLSNTSSALSGTCPTGAAIVDEVSFGTTATNCLFGMTGAPSNTTAALRGGFGCSFTGNLSTDFSVGTPTPRNSASPTIVCPTVPNPATTVSISPDPASAVAGTGLTFTATARDASNNVTSTTFTWESSNTAVATINPTTGVASALIAGTSTIKVTTANGVSTTTTLTVSPAPVVTGDVVISQIYGGGGNASATYTNDYVELFNRGTETADISGWTVQYTSATGASWSPSNVVVLPSATIAPGKYYLVQLTSGGANGVALPTPDVTGAINMGQNAGKVILTVAGIAPGATSCPSSGVIDRVGYGTTSNCADWGTTANISSTLAAFRQNDGCIKTGISTNDFIALTPVPHNSASPLKNCAGVSRMQSTATIVINEIMADPVNAAGGKSWGEWFEVHNTGASPVNLNGWKIISGGTSQPDHTIGHDVIVAAGGYALLGRGDDIAQNGGVTLDYNYFVGGATTIWLDDADFLELVDAADARVDSVAWTSTAHGVTRGLRSDASGSHVDVNGANWGYASTVFGDGDYGTPGADNEPLVNVAPTVSAFRISISGRVATDAPLPVGFEAQLFATELTDLNAVVPGVTFTWVAQTPAIATIDGDGVIHAVSPGTARFLVTSSDGTAKIHTLEMITPVASATAQYLDNAAFGEPVDGDASNDFIIHRPQYTTSFNHLLGTPNWVAYDLNSTDITPGQDRCNCFTFDPELEAAGFTKYTTADYTGAGAFAGAGIDRGHMTRSFDRTSGTLDNARTFYFSNVVPQFSDLNQGPWANFENYLGDLATSQNKEVYIYVGPAGSLGTVKDQHKINIPAYTWKIALVLPRGKGLADVHDYRDVENVIAVVMKNEPGAGVRSADWTTSYVVTADSVERLTGYHFMSALDARTQRALKTGTKPPLGSLDGPYSAAEGSAVSMSSAGSIDPNGSIVSYAWDFGDGNTGSGATPSHTYALAGSFNVSMIVTDNDGLADTVATTATISAVPPHAAVDGPYNAPEGTSINMSGAASNDPNGTVVSYAWDFGDGNTGSGATVSHTYAHAGSYTIGLTVTDNDGRTDATSTSATITAVPPVAATDGPYTGSEGSSVSMSGAASNDPNGTVVSYAWDFGDGNTGSGATVSHTYANNGSYTVGLTVTDNDGRTDAISTSATISNVAPNVASFSGATMLPGETYSASGSFTDPGADTWTATVNYGDGSGAQALTLTGKTFSPSHTYASAGTFTVTVTVSDGEVAGSRTATVIVLTGVQGISSLTALVNQLISSGALSSGNGNSLIASLGAASNQLGSGNAATAKNQLEAFLNKVDSMVKTGKLTAAQGAALTELAQRIIAAV